MLKSEAKTTKQRVEFILQNNERARSEDRVLIMMVYWVFYREAFKKIDKVWYLSAYEFVNNFPSTESIRRCRQKFQEFGKYQATKKVEKARMKLEYGVHHSIKTEDWAKHLPE